MLCQNGEQINSQFCRCLHKPPWTLSYSKDQTWSLIYALILDVSLMCWRYIFANSWCIFKRDVLEFYFHITFYFHMFSKLRRYDYFANANIYLASLPFQSTRRCTNGVSLNSRLFMMKLNISRRHCWFRIANKNVCKTKSAIMNKKYR